MHLAQPGIFCAVHSLSQHRSALVLPFLSDVQSALSSLLFQHHPMNTCLRYGSAACFVMPLSDRRNSFFTLTTQKNGAFRAEKRSAFSVITAGSFYGCELQTGPEAADAAMKSKLASYRVCRRVGCVPAYLPSILAAFSTATWVFPSGTLPSMMSWISFSRGSSCTSRNSSASSAWVPLCRPWARYMVMTSSL